MILKKPIPEDVRIEMIPLLDVIFVLLIVFIFALVQRQAPKGLDVQLPKATGEVVPHKEIWVMSVPYSAEPTAPQVWWQEQSMALGELALRIREAQPALEQAVVLSIDERVPHGFVVRLMELLQQEGLTRITWQTQSKE